ncbi:hypothetical protein ElyMa_002604400 [Elysia marginata]|uniref:Uncharacterized protein n=1 Tax=Elysia marginata TaxID=1093978 RepID=A0AAV4H2S9_9GAST|nr:hypothetical protein ElyMa_002604400 [Elysia marginata]
MYNDIKKATSLTATKTASLKNKTKDHGRAAGTLGGACSGVLHHTKRVYKESIFIRTKADGYLFNTARLHGALKVWRVLIPEIMLTNDAALVSNKNWAEGTCQLGC